MPPDKHINSNLASLFSIIYIFDFYKLFLCGLSVYTVYNLYLTCEA